MTSSSSQPSSEGAVILKIGVVGEVGALVVAGQNPAKEAAAALGLNHSLYSLEYLSCYFSYLKVTRFFMGRLPPPPLASLRWAASSDCVLLAFSRDELRLKVAAVLAEACCCCWTFVKMVGSEPVMLESINIDRGRAPFPPCTFWNYRLKLIGSRLDWPEVSLPIENWDDWQNREDLERMAKAYKEDI